MDLALPWSPSGLETNEKLPPVPNDVIETAFVWLQSQPKNKAF